MIKGATYEVEHSLRSFRLIDEDELSNGLILLEQVLEVPHHVATLSYKGEVLIHDPRASHHFQAKDKLNGVPLNA